MIRVGLLGAGPWASEFHAPMLSTADGLTLTAVWARRPQAAHELAKQFGVISAPSVDELFRQVDAVAFTIPPDVQPELAVRAARAGKHLLLEKPLAFTVEDAEAIVDAATRAGVATRVVLTYRFTPAVQHFLAAVEGSQVRAAVGAFVSGAALAGSSFATPWRQQPAASLFDLGPHALDLLDAAAGPVEWIHATESGGVFSIATRHAGGAGGHLTLSLVTPNAPGALAMQAVSSDGVVTMGDPADDDMNDVRRAIAQEFVAAIEGRATLGIDARRGLLLQRLLNAAAASARTGRIIPLHRAAGT